MILQGSPGRLSGTGRATLLIALVAAMLFTTHPVWGEEDAPAPTFVERLERLERLVEELLERERTPPRKDAAADERSHLLERPSDDRSAEVVTKVYHVADLVVPLPGAGPGENDALADIAAWTRRQQQAASEGSEQLLWQKAPQDAAPDFDTLIDVITSTIAPDTWEMRGGHSKIVPALGSLSLVIHQSREVHQQVADLLEQSRRLLETQIVVEARFLVVPEDFLHKAGLDIELSVQPIPVVSETGEDGLERIGVDFDAIPNHATRAALLAHEKHVVLTDREMRLLMQIEKATIVAAPKITIFNGQRAFIHFGAALGETRPRSPLVKSLQRRKAEGAQAMISLGLQGVASGDRRQVRLSVAPLVHVQRMDQAGPGAAKSSLHSPRGASAAAPVPAELGATVTANVAEGYTLVIDVGAASPADNASRSQHLLLLVTPRVMTAEEGHAGAENVIEGAEKSRR